MSSSSRLPQTLGELQTSKEFYEARVQKRSVKDELRENLIARLKSRQQIFPASSVMKIPLSRKL